MIETMHINLDEFYSSDLLRQAEKRLITQLSGHIHKVCADPEAPETDLICFHDAELSLAIEEAYIGVQLDRIPSCLQDKYLPSNIIEYNKHAHLFGLLDLNKPPKFLAAKSEINKYELYIIAKLIENALLITFQMTKFAEFQFYSHSNLYLGILSRLRLRRDIMSGFYFNHDCLIFTEKYKIEKRDIELLEDISTIVEQKDYCFEDLPTLLDELKDLTLKPQIEAEVVVNIEQLYRIKIPKTPLFYRFPFLAWDQRDRTHFYVPDENITIISY